MGISVTKLLIVLAVVVILFGTQRLRNLGSDLGEAIKSFRRALQEGENEQSDKKEDDAIEGEITSEKSDRK